MLEREYVERVEGMLTTAGAIRLLPKKLQPTAARVADFFHHSSDRSDGLQDLADLALFDPSLSDILIQARDQELPKKPELHAEAVRILRNWSNQQYVNNPPPISQRPSWFERTVLHSPAFDIRYGLPIHGTLVTSNPQFRFIGANLDTRLLRDMYWENGDQEQLKTQLSEYTDRVLKTPVPKPPQKIIDRHRFLGYEDEPTFRKEIEEQLLSRMEKKGVATEKVLEAIQFARASDRIRLSEKGKNTRSTGEHWYCHYLSTAWYLWTMIEDDLPADPTSLYEAGEDIALALIHDIAEDLKTNLFTQYPPSGPKTIPFRILNNSYHLELTADQWTILTALTKIGEEDGAQWLDRINKLPEANLKRRAARIKAADRFTNLPSLVYAADNFADAFRKLEETRRAGGRLLYLARYADQGVFTTYTNLKTMQNTNRLTTFLTSLPYLAEVEQYILLSKFGTAYQEGLRLINEPWAKAIVTALNTHVIHPKTHSASSLPPYLRRQEELIRSFQMTELEQRYMMPLVELKNFLGLDYFVEDRQFGEGPGPIEFKHYLPLVIRSGTFLRFFTTEVRGVQPGGLDALFLPDIHLVQWYWNDFYHDANELLLGYITLTAQQAREMKYH